MLLVEPETIYHERSMPFKADILNSNETDSVDGEKKRSGKNVYIKTYTVRKTCHVYTYSNLTTSCTNYYSHKLRCDSRKTNLNEKLTINARETLRRAALYIFKQTQC